MPSTRAMAGMTLLSLFSRIEYKAYAEPALARFAPERASKTRRLRNKWDRLTLYQMIDLHRDQADVIGEVFCPGELLDIADKLFAELVRTKTDSLAHIT